MPIPNNYQAPIVLSAKERAFEQLQMWIIDGTLQPGEKINDVDVAKAIGVSRTPVREALQMLSMQGFVSMKPGVATTVNATHPEDLSKILPPLAALESLAAEFAAQSIQQDDVRILQDLNDKFAFAIQDGDAFAALKVDDQFHSKIIKLSNNPYIEAPMTMLQAHVRRLFFQHSIVLTEESVTEHQQLIAALSAHAAEDAALIAKNNWLRPIRKFM